MKTTPILSLVLLGTLIAVPELQASFSAPYVGKINALVTHITPIFKAIAWLGIVTCIGFGIYKKVNGEPMHVERLVVILLLCVALCNLDSIKTVFGI